MAPTPPNGPPPQPRALTFNAACLCLFDWCCVVMQVQPVHVWCESTHARLARPRAREPRRRTAAAASTRSSGPTCFGVTGTRGREGRGLRLPPRSVRPRPSRAPSLLSSSRAPQYLTSWPTDLKGQGAWERGCSVTRRGTRGRELYTRHTAFCLLLL